MQPHEPIEEIPEPGQYNPKVHIKLPPADGQQPDSSYSKKLTAVAIVVLLLIIGIGAFTLSSNKKNPSANGSASIGAPAAAQVDITSAGFTPGTVSVQVGQAVTWTNNDSSTHSVASDPYPTDNTLVNFNSKQDLNKNDHFSFVFNKAGTYTYHDDLNPYSLEGTVIVKQ